MVFVGWVLVRVGRAQFHMVKYPEVGSVVIIVAFLKGSVGGTYVCKSV